MRIYYNNLTMSDALAVIMQALFRKTKQTIFFLNAYCVYQAEQDTQYREILDRADLVLPDGIGLRIGTWILGGRMKENCNGSDFSPICISSASRAGYQIFLLGGEPGIADKAAKKLMELVPKVLIAGTHHGYFEDDDEVVSRINQSGAQLLLVAMGVPRQEKWIMKNRDRLNPTVCLGVGAFFDYLSENVQRAPSILRRIHLEWFWRFFIEPKRLFKRYFIYGPYYIFVVIKWRLIEVIVGNGAKRGGEKSSILFPTRIE
jgi:N-acetylglucosaminyldiphosphoundecaprenol N-acetyl-beta-D-mannosaminyltransferase